MTKQDGKVGKVEDESKVRDPMTLKAFRVPEVLWEKFVRACTERHYTPGERLRELIRDDIQKIEPPGGWEQQAKE